MTGVISRLNHGCFYHPRINFVSALLVKKGDEITPTKIQRFVSLNLHHNSNSLLCETIQFLLIKRKTIVHQIKGMFTRPHGSWVGVKIELVSRSFQSHRYCLGNEEAVMNSGSLQLSLFHQTRRLLTMDNYKGL